VEVGVASVAIDVLVSQGERKNPIAVGNGVFWGELPLPEQMGVQRLCATETGDTVAEHVENRNTYSRQKFCTDNYFTLCFQDETAF